MKRRDFVWTSLMATAACGTRGGAGASLEVNTTTGPLRGALENEVTAFKGIPYGASTAGPRRFLPPAKPEPWTGVREALALGPQAPQVKGPLPEFFRSIDSNEGGFGEDCLNLHVWTPAADGARRPVMVWLHGGGFVVSSANWPIYNGANLARHGVVVVTVNHRLNLFGFLHLADMGVEKYAGAANVGMLDIVAALEWVRDNIAAFGGDPANVTVFGESGGAAKVSTLLGFAPARGLFHRAIVQSGAALTAIPREQAARDAAAFLAKLGVRKTELDRLQELPVETLQQAAAAVPGLAAGPSIDGRALPDHVFTPKASEIGAGVPLLIGTTATEVTGLLPEVTRAEMEEAEFLAAVKQALPKATPAALQHVIEAYKSEGRVLREAAYFLQSDAGFRRDILTQMERKAEQSAAGGAPVYAYYLTWPTPVADGKFLSPHTLDIPFVFDNLDLARDMVGDGPEQNRLRNRMVGAWVAFARSGMPAHNDLPEWTPFDLNTRATMVFDDDCRLVSDPRKEQRLAVEAALQG